MMSSISQKLVLLSPSSSSSGVTQFQRVVQSQLDLLQQAPILMISSETASSTSYNNPIKQVANACQLVRFTLGQLFGLRTVETKVSSVFPTVQDVDQRLDLMQRTGASSVVAVGSGAAMDLAKAIVKKQQAEQNSSNLLLLVPATHGAMLASGASHSLLLDSVEEKLVPIPRGNFDCVATVEDCADYDFCNSSTMTMVAPLETNQYMEPMKGERLSNLLQSVATLLLDAGMQKTTNPSLPFLLDSTIQLLSTSTDNNGNIENVTAKLLFQSANLLSYGLPGANNKDRSIPLALMASLLPTIFPQTHPITFLARLVPGLCHVLNTTNKNKRDLPQLTVLMDVLENQRQQLRLPPILVHDQYKGFSIPDMAVSCIESNQQLWNCLDADMDTLMTVLQLSFAEHGN
jgi:hypothetical protein